MATFGNTDFEHTGQTEIRIAFRAGLFLFSGATGSVADSITIKLRASSAGRVQCGMYDTSRDIITNGKTEYRDFSGRGWGETSEETFNYTGTKPVLTNGASYYLAAWTAATWSEAYLKYVASVGDEIEQYYTGAEPTEIPDSFTNQGQDADVIACIYCTYSPGAVAHEHAASDTLSISDAVAYKQDHVQGLSDTLAISDSVVYVHTVGAVPVVKRPRIPYGLKPARIPQVGRIGA